jgi:hypothetical protein
LLEYAPLPTPTSIRLLKIERLEHLEDDLDLCRPISCSLVTKDLNDICKFDALSYTWGNPLGRVPGPEEGTPECDGWSAPAFEINCGDKQIKVTTNLYSALLVLRYYLTVAVGLDFPKLSDHIWIDQICIDQTNTTEKNAQVRLMSRIYRQASSTQVWLGGNDKCADDFQHISERLAPLDYENATKYTPYNILQRRTYKALGIQPISRERWHGALKFLCRAWFHRSWIVQEVVLASNINVFCGLRVLHFSQLIRFCSFLDDSGWFNYLISDPFLEQQNFNLNKIFLKLIHKITYRMGTGRFPLQDRYFGRPFSLGDLTRVLRSSDATDSRDKIFSFISLSKEFINQNGTSIIPDYNKSGLDVYIEATKLFMSSGGCDLAHFSQREDESRRQLSSLPSWVPDFSVKTGHNPLVGAPYPWSADAGLRNSRIDHLPGPALGLKGTRVDTVHSVQRFDTSYFYRGNMSEIDSTKFVDILSDGLIQILQHLPDVSIITNPPGSQTALEEFFERNGSFVTFDDRTVPVMESIDGSQSTTRQSRFEVFWRTMLQNHLINQYPAPEFCGEALLNDIRDAFYLRLAQALCYEVQSKLSSGAGYIDWEALTRKIGREYTHLRTLEGFHPYGSDEIIYPSGFKPVMKLLGLAWNNTKAVEEPKRVRAYCDMVERLADSHFRSDNRRATVRNRVLATCMGRILLATNKARIGTGLQSTRAGDEVWVLAGAPIPCLLRPTGDGRYRLIGEAYIHGIMHGEAIGTLGKEDFDSVVVV